MKLLHAPADPVTKRHNDCPQHQWFYPEIIRGLNRETIHPATHRNCTWCGLKQRRGRRHNDPEWVEIRWVDLAPPTNGVANGVWRAWPA